MPRHVPARRDCRADKELEGCSERRSGDSVLFVHDNVLEVHTAVGGSVTRLDGLVSGCGQVTTIRFFNATTLGEDQSWG